VRWQKTGDLSRIRVTPELVEIGAGGLPTTRWQQAFDADLKDVFEVQGRIATQVAQALELALGAKEQGQLEERPTSNLAAWEAFLKGREIDDAGMTWRRHSVRPCSSSGPWRSTRSSRSAGSIFRSCARWHS